MEIEAPSIHPDNQVLAGLVDFQGNPCGHRVLEKALTSDLIVLIGEPAVGKSTIRAQITNELIRRDICTDEVIYDTLLDNHTKLTGSEEEGTSFNQYLVQQVHEAITRRTNQSKVLFDTVGIGNTSPKDRSVSALNQLLQPDSGLQNVIPFVMGVVGSLNSQFLHTRTRYEILMTRPQDIISMLAKNYNIVVADIPQDITSMEMGKRIKNAVLKMATQLHVAYISTEVVMESLEQAKRTNIKNAMGNITIQENLNSASAETLPYKAYYMIKRLQDFNIPEEQKIGVFNTHRREQVTWYARSFL